MANGPSVTGVRVDSEPRELGHVAALDGIRGIAVLLVVGLHYGFVLQHEDGGLLPGGFLGVNLFFVLSGFLITSLLLSERGRAGSISMRGFYTRRALRLLPALVGLLVFHLFYAAHTDIPWRHEAVAQLSILFYVSNWVQAFGFDMPNELAHTWTLSVEEQFYLLWPLALAFLLVRARSQRVIFGAVIAGIVASALIRAWLWHFGSGFPAAYIRTDARVDELLVGAAFAFAWRWRWLEGRWVSRAGAVALAFLIAVVALWDQDFTVQFSGGYTVIALAAGFVIAAATGPWRPRAVFEWGPLRQVGRVSYGLYLWHLPCLYLASRGLASHAAGVQASVGLLITAAATWFSWRVIEQPFLRLKVRYQVVEPPAIVAPTSFVAPAPAAS
jgi:peptidoglycan/LPS O-acetylase OafA/YrhL